MKYRIGCLATALILSCSQTSFGAESQQQMDPNTEEEMSDNSWISNGKELGNWWIKNPKKYDPLPLPLLYHFEGSYTYSELGGNIDSENHSGAVELALRKQLFTSITGFDVSKNETSIALSGISTSVESQNFQQTFRYGLTDGLEAVGGLIWNMNDSKKYLENRVIYYGGARFTVLDLPGLTVKMGGFYGFSDTEYMSDSISGMQKYSDFQSVDDYDTDNLYFRQMLRWKINENITFSENADYLLALEDTEYYKWMLKLALNFKLTEHTSFVTSYTVNYDNNSFVEAVQDYLDARRAAGSAAGEMETTDTVLAVGVKFSY